MISKENLAIVDTGNLAVAYFVNLAGGLDFEVLSIGISCGVFIWGCDVVVQMLYIAIVSSKGKFYGLLLWNIFNAVIWWLAYAVS